MTRSDVLQRIRSLGALLRWVVVFGSASAMMRYPQFRRAGDIDLVAHPMVFFILCIFFRKEWKMELPKDGWWSPSEIRLVNPELKIEMFMSWKMGSSFIPYNKLKKHTECIDGIYCVTIDLVIRYKKILNRPKDQRDINMIKIIKELQKATSIPY